MELTNIMKSFDEVLDDIEALHGMELHSLSGSASNIIITEVNRQQERVMLQVVGDGTDSRSFDELRKIYNALARGGFVHVDSAINGSGNSRNRPQTIYACLPYIEWALIDRKKMLICMDSDTHQAGTSKQMTEAEVDAWKVEHEGQPKEMAFHIDMPPTRFSLNRIVFGAPGTGKSWKLEQERKELGGAFERVTFHPDYSYAQFVGTYKPVMGKDENGKDTIRYDFTQGPFMRVFVDAVRDVIDGNPRPHLLIIEEINRARVAAVFGDVFQLLDRGSDGTSEYAIHASEDIKKHLSEELGIEESACAEIRIPNNMYIWATMNSADQGVFPMDTAFKRRWDFEYLSIDGDDAIDGSDGGNDDTKCWIALAEKKPDEMVLWDDLRKAINDRLADFKVNEDKFLGPYFISKKFMEKDIRNIVTRQDEFRRAFANKVLMYLFEDAAKPYREKFFDGKTRYSEILESLKVGGIRVFGEDFAKKFYREHPDKPREEEG